MTGWVERLAGLLVAMAIGAALSVAGALAYGERCRQQGAAEVQARWDAQRVQAEVVATEAALSARQEESRRSAAQQEAVSAAQDQTIRARADAARATAVAAELRQRIAVATAAGGATTCDAAAAGNGTPAGGTADLSADVQRRLDDAADELAAAADAARIAGGACERSYDALSAR